MAQDVADLVPRVRRAIEGPKALPEDDPRHLTDEEILAITADAIGQVILLTEGAWPHTLIRDPGADPTSSSDDSWTVDPELTEVEAEVVAAQVAITYFFFVFQNQKTSERIQNEGQEWEYTYSAQALVRQIDTLKDTRDRALNALVTLHPVLASYASFLHERDRVAAALLEPWRAGGIGGQDQGMLIP